MKLTIQDFMARASSLKAAGKKERMYVMHIYETSFQVQRVLKAPIPDQADGIGIFANVLFEPSSNGISLHWGPCSLSKECSPGDAPFTTDQGVYWSYWTLYNKITDAEEAEVRVAFADLFVNLRALYGTVLIADDRLKAWHAQRERNMKPKLIFTTNTATF